MTKKYFLLRFTQPFSKAYAQSNISDAINTKKKFVDYSFVFILRREYIRN